MALKLNVHRNTVYGHLEWAKHKSPWRHGRQMLSTISFGILAALAPPVFLSTITATFVTLVNYGVLERRLPGWVPMLEISITPFQLLSPVLALLLVFRTNASYMRFDEARKLWGSTHTRSRDLARQVLTWVSMAEDQERKELVLRYLKAYPYFLKHHLTQGASTEELENILHQGEVEAVTVAQSRPIYVLQVIFENINQCKVGDYERTMDSNLTQFHDNMVGCERLFKTPIPVAYTRLLSRVLMLWHLALPYGLWNSCGWLTAPATFMSAVALFYIEQVGVMIEEPFSILPLDNICSGITEAIDELCVAHEEAMVMRCGIKDSYAKPPPTPHSPFQVKPPPTPHSPLQVKPHPTPHSPLQVKPPPTPHSPLHAQLLPQKADHIVLKINPNKAPSVGHPYSDMSLIFQRSPRTTKTIF